MSSTAPGPWLSLRDAASHVGHHRSMLFRALKVGELHGHQRYPGASWRVHIDAIEAWIRGDETAAACGCTQQQDPRPAAS